jgi:hypothetical protein
MSEIKHTPTPWTKDRHEQLRGADGRAVNVWGLGIGWASRDDETEGNSELILDAVNSHASLTAERDRLREENERLRAALSEIATTEEYRGLTAEEAMRVAQTALKGGAA